MMTPHLLNLFIHVGAGIAAMALGFYLLWTPKGTRRHRTRGRAYAALTLVVCAAAAAGLVLFRLFAEGAMAGAAASVMVSTLAALALLLAYDAARWLFPRRWHAALWRYEHVYKILGCLFGMLSAAVGNTVRAGQPWSQLAPSVLGIAAVLCCWVRTYRAQRRRGDCADSLDSQASPLAKDA
jgi:uncharacterized membrane protein